MRFIAEAKKLGPEDEAELKEILLKSDGLCAVHYSQMVSLVGNKMPKWFVEFQENKFKSLLERAGRFIEFSAWGRQKDFASLSPEDKVVWKELASTLRGSID